MIINECSRYCNRLQSSEIYLLNSRAEKNYVRRFLNGKELRVSTLLVLRLKNYEISMIA